MSNEQKEDESIPTVLHELNVARGEINHLIREWHEIPEDERAEEIRRCHTLLGYAVDRAGDDRAE